MSLLFKNFGKNENAKVKELKYYVIRIRDKK